AAAAPGRSGRLAVGKRGAREQDQLGSAGFESPRHPTLVAQREPPARGDILARADQLSAQPLPRDRPVHRRELQRRDANDDPASGGRDKSSSTPRRRGERREKTFFKKKPPRSPRLRGALEAVTFSCRWAAP